MSGKLFRHCLHTHARDNRACIAQVNLQVVVQAFDMVDVCNRHLDKTIISADVKVLRFAAVSGMYVAMKITGTLDSLQEAVEWNGLQQEV